MNAPLDHAAGLAADNVLRDLNNNLSPGPWDLDELGFRLGGMYPASLHHNPTLYLVALLVARMARTPL